MPTNEHFDEINRTLGRIEEKVDNLSTLPARVDNLENWRSFLSGAWAVMAAFGVYLFRGSK
jgi:hypothetical protein